MLLLTTCLRSRHPQSALGMLAPVVFALLAADAKKPHINQGVNAPFPTKRQDIQLSSGDEATLAAGKPVFRQVVSPDGKGGRALAVQDIAASVDTVWGRIFAFSDYPKMVNGVKETSVYDERRSGDTRTIKVRMKLGMMGVTLEYFIDHTYSQKNSVMTWTLDYSRLSDLIDSVGYWCMLPHPTKPGYTRALYSVEAAFPSWVPGFVVSAITSKALTDATGWVKVEAEKEQIKLGGVEGGAAVPTTKKACKAAGGTWSKKVCDMPPPPPPPPPSTVRVVMDGTVNAIAIACLVLSLKSVVIG